MRVLDLFSGLGGWSQAFLDRGHDVTRLDNDERFKSVPRTMLCDALAAWWIAYDWDIILVSPPYAKPTDLWGELPPAFVPKACKKRNPDHEAAPRGSPTGTQRLNDPALKGLIPYGLSQAMCMAAEQVNT